MARELLIDRGVYVVDDATRTYRFARRNPDGVDAATSNRNKRQLIGYRRIMSDGRSKPFRFVPSRNR